MGQDWIRGLAVWTKTTAFHHFRYAMTPNWAFNFKAFDHEGPLFDQFALKKD